MGWVTEHGKHEGWAATVVHDGRIVAAWQGDKMLVGDPPDYDEFPRTDVSAWVAACDCGWRGSWWKRVTSRDAANPDTRAVYSPDGGEAPPEVEAAINEEWRRHVAPDLALADVQEAAETSAAARARLDETVRVAVAVGTSWAGIGRATGMSRQAARGRWGVGRGGGSAASSPP